MANKNVEVIIAPVKGNDGMRLNIDFSSVSDQLEQLDNRARDWDLRLMDGRRHIGDAKFSAYQFMADGLERRTISLKNLTLQPRARNQGKTYDLMKFMLNTVKTECDREWGPVYGDAVVFVEKRNLASIPEVESSSLFDFLKKITDKVIGGESVAQPSTSDLAVSVAGDHVSMQLIKGHLQRSAKAENRDPRKNR